MRAAGLEPISARLGNRDNSNTSPGQSKPKHGQNAAAGQTASRPSGHTGTAARQSQDDVSNPKRARIVLKDSDTSNLDADLRLVNDAWDSLPEAVRAGIVAMVNAARGK